MRETCQSELDEYLEFAEADNADTAGRGFTVEQASLVADALVRHGYLHAIMPKILQGFREGIQPQDLLYSFCATMFQMGREFESWKLDRALGHKLDPNKSRVRR